MPWESNPSRTRQEFSYLFLFILQSAKRTICQSPKEGIQPRVLWIGIGGSIFFGVLESTKRMLAERRPKPGQESKQD
ncbi:hypothetical protein V6N13_127523 [Hibiscus sabdariffa]